MSNELTSGGQQPALDAFLQPLTLWNPAWGLVALEFMFYQWEMLTLCQRVAEASQREFTDQWRCRFGGGVPLDG